MERRPLLLTYGLVPGMSAEVGSAAGLAAALSAFRDDDFAACVRACAQAHAAPASPVDTGRILLVSGTALLAMGLAEHAADHLARAHALAEEHGEQTVRVYAVTHLGAAACQTRSPVLARRFLAAAREACGTAHTDVGAYLDFHDACVDLAAIPWTSSIWTAGGGDGGVPPAPPPHSAPGDSVERSLVLAVSRFCSGGIDAGFADLQAGCAAASASGSAVLQAAAGAWLGYALMQLGHARQGLDHLRHALHLARRTRCQFNVVRIDRWIAEAHMRLDDARGAYAAAHHAARLETALGAGRAIHRLISYAAARGMAGETFGTLEQPGARMAASAPRFVFDKLLEALDAPPAFEAAPAP